MIKPSPAPRKRRRLPRIAGFVALAAVVVLAGAGLSYPLWAGPLVRDAITSRLGRRLEQPVEIEAIDLGYGSVQVARLQIGSPGGPTRIVFEKVDVELHQVGLWPTNVDVDRVWVRGGHVEGDRADLEELVRRLVARSAGPTGEGDGGGGGSLLPAKLEVDTVRVTVREAQRGQVQAWLEVDAEPRERRATVALRDVRAGFGQLPASFARRVEATVEGGDDPLLPAFPVRLAVQGMAATLTPQVAVAGVEGEVVLADPGLVELSVDLEGGFSSAAEGDALPGEGEKLWSLAGTFKRDLSAGSARLQMESFELGRVPEVLARLPVVDSGDATVGGHLALEFGEGRAHLEGDVAIAGVNISHPLLASTVVNDVGMSLEFDADLDPDLPALTINRARISRAGVALELDGRLVHPSVQEHRRYRVHARVPKVPCQKALDAFPDELVPSLVGFALDGDFDLDLTLDVDFADLDALSLGGHVGIWKCAVRRVPARVSGARLAGSFTHRVTMRDGRERIVRLQPGSGSFTALAQISPHMQAAVLTTEDGGFYGHRGFLPKHIEEALRRNLKAGRVRLGASTITMQMVKNVLLSHERTFSRKLQEMFLTWTVERALTKQRIMEIYLNVIEMAPGVYGVTRAAAHYFGKHPEELNPLEAAYLALMLPNPVGRHGHYCRGAVGPRFDVKLRRILRIMHSRGRISEEEYEQWKEGELVFDLRERGSQEECLAELRELARADEGQKALTGLLGGGANRPPDEDDIVVDIGLPDRLPSLDDPDGTLPPPDPSEADAPGRPAMEPDGAADG